MSAVVLPAYRPRPQRPSSFARRSAYQKGLFAEYDRISAAIEREDRETILSRSADAIEALMTEQVDRERQGDLHGATILSGRIAAWRFQVGARRTE